MDAPEDDLVDAPEDGTDQPPKLTRGTGRTNPDRTPAKTTRASAVTRGIVLVADFLIQVLLIWLGIRLLLEEDDEKIIDTLVIWCFIGSLYWLCAVIVVATLAYGRRRAEARHPILAWMDLNPVSRLVATLATFLASFVGLAAAVELLVLREDEDWAEIVNVVAVWAMLLAWALFHWGFARIYARRYERAIEKPLLFPGTPAPGLVDFVYFSFSNATSFAVSDVQVMTTRMRWTVVWHTTLSFFLNAMIIVLAVNTIMN
jgi:uncharacterized membrane protein